MTRWSPSVSIVAVLRMLGVAVVLVLAGSVALGSDEAEAGALVDPAPAADPATEELEPVTAVTARGGELPATPRRAQALAAPRIARPPHAPATAPPVPPPER